VRRRRADPAARLSRPAAGGLLQRGLAPGQQAAAPPAGPAEPRLDLRPGGGDAGRRPPDPGDHRPHRPAVVQAGGGRRVPRHRRHPADRQFRLDARPADHGGRRLRRHPGPHAGALRGQGRGAGLHHPRLEGRQRARRVDQGRQAARARPPERPAPHHLQERRRAVAAGPQEPGPDDARGAAEGKHRRRGPDVGPPAPDRPARSPPHSDGDLRRRAGGRLHPQRQFGPLSGAPLASGDRRDRDQEPGRADRRRHRPRRDALLPPGGDHRRRRATGRRPGRPAGRPVRRGAQGGEAGEGASGRPADRAAPGSENGRKVPA
jgi:hypothetical protein